MSKFTNNHNLSFNQSSFFNTSMNNDLEEKMLRRKIALNDKHKKNKTSTHNPDKSKIINRMDNHDTTMGGSTPLPALNTLSVEEINKRYEEWMKIAADNKINSTNTWNFALIDYFHELSLFRDGDTINFQKASCTLDGCMKIYSSRVDSAATETGRLLNGLVDNNIKDLDTINEELDAETGEKPKRKANRSEQTLAKDFTQLTVKQFDLEFSVDPLFKKTSADFDEGGARGLLLNHLSIQGDGRMIFDSGDAAITEDGSVPVQPLVTESVDRDFLELDSLTFSIFNDDSAPQFICPSLKDFQLGQDTTLDLNNLKPYETAENEDDDYEGDIKFESDSFFQSPPDFDGGIDLPLDDFNEPDFMDNINGDGFEGNDNNLNEDGEIDSEKPNYPAQASLTSNENIFSYFDDNINKGWAGPEHWRVKGNKNKEVKNKEVKEGSGTTTKTKSKGKSKEDEFIDFFNYEELDLHTLFAPSKGTINNPKLHDSESSNYLLPDDLHFTSKTFMNLFVKPKFQLKPITSKSRNYDENDMNVSKFMVVPEDSEEVNINDSGSRPGSPSGQDQMGEMDFDMDIGNGFDQDNDQPIDVYSDEEEIPPTQFNDAEYSHLNLGDQLIPELRKVESVSINYMKINKRVDVKKLKSNLWRELEELRPLPDPQVLEGHFQAPSEEQTQQKTFSSVCQNLKSHYPKKQFQDISVPFCFISLLHLANEEGLKLEGNSNLNELVITKE